MTKRRSPLRVLATVTAAWLIALLALAAVLQAIYFYRGCG